MLTSHSFIRESGELNRIHIATQKYCHVSWKKANSAECQRHPTSSHGNDLHQKWENTLNWTGLRGSSVSSSCAERRAEAQACDLAIQRAERWINLGGCATSIQSLSTCEAEWCRSSGRSVNNSPKSLISCQQECAVVRQKLDECTKRIISQRLTRQGLTSLL